MNGFLVKMRIDLPNYKILNPTHLFILIADKLLKKAKMGNSSTKLAEKCSLLSKDEIPVVASSFKIVSKNSERIKEDDLMVRNTLNR